MAEKRAKDRVILKLIGVAGFVYSEDEADAFKEERPDSMGRGATAYSRQSQLPSPRHRRRWKTYPSTITPLAGSGWTRKRPRSMASANINQIAGLGSKHRQAAWRDLQEADRELYAELIDYSARYEKLNSRRQIMPHFSRSKIKMRKDVGMADMHGEPVEYRGIAVLAVSPPSGTTRRAALRP